MNLENDGQNTDNSFYRAFEDRFRGSRETIKSRLKVYLPFIEPLKKIHEPCNAIDLGCGRGEWLELLTETGMAAYGVDLDDGMLAACRERGFSVENAEAISYLKSLPDESQSIVSGFHIIEHIPFPSLQIMVQEALRVLRPAGLLMLETPNTENITVGISSFYLDPTHIHPIPSQLLAFLPEYYGFHRHKILRLQEPLTPDPDNHTTLFDVLYGVSMDYSVVAQKRATEDQLQIFDLAFSRDYGISLEKYVSDYDVQAAQVLVRINLRLNNIQTELHSTQTELQNTQIELQNIYHSRSWRITAPLREFGDSGRRFRHSLRRLFPLRTLPKRILFRIFRTLAVKVILPLSENRTAYAIVNRFPAIKRQIQRLMKRIMYETQQAPLHATAAGQSIPLSPAVMRIYQDLVNQIKKHNP